jgi:hypothetical protein
VAAHYTAWPSIVALCGGTHHNGPYDARNGALYAIDREDLAARLRAYFDTELSDEEMARICADLMDPKTGYAPALVRQNLQRSSSFDENHIYRMQFKPMDRRWYYCELRSSLCCRPSPDLMLHVFPQNRFLVTRSHAVADPEGAPFYMSSTLVERDHLRGHARLIPLRVSPPDRSSREGLFNPGKPHANLSKPARAYLVKLGIKDPDAEAKTAGLIWMHALAIGYSPAYLSENADGIRRDWPRIPLPADRKALEASAALGEQVAALLDTEADVPGATCGKIATALKTIGVPSKAGGGELDPNTTDFVVTAGWGHKGKEGVTMPARGKLDERQYDVHEAKAIDDEAAARGMSAKDARRLLGDKTLDVYLNGTAYWRNIPRAVWDYYIGGYQVIKKWLSYREEPILGRPLKPEEARDVTNTARRIATILLLQPALDDNYQKVKAATHPWSKPDA